MHRVVVGNRQVHPQQSLPERERERGWGKGETISVQEVGVEGRKEAAVSNILDWNLREWMGEEEGER